MSYLSLLLAKITNLPGLIMHTSQLPNEKNFEVDSSGVKAQKGTLKLLHRILKSKQIFIPKWHLSKQELFTFPRSKKIGTALH